MKSERIQKLDNIPTLIMLVGIVGSGKSTYAKSLKDDYTIHSSDALREEMFGDVNENSKESNAKLFEELHRRIKRDLQNGNNVVYDATNINRRRRINFLSEIKNIPCYKVCHLVMSPYYLCVRRNRCRERFVPEEVIKRMYMNFQPPHKSEGWDEIDIILSCKKKDFKDYNIEILYNFATGINYFNQDNKHHSFTLGEHCRKAKEYVAEHYPTNQILYDIALIHDEGKVFTRTIINSKGIKDGDCHYYQHHCVGAYNSIFYMINKGYEIDEILHAASVIFFHMHPYNEWKDNKKLEERMKLQIGETLYNDIIALHEADQYAH